MKKNLITLAFAICACALFVVGCGDGKPKTYTITGTVKVAGETIETGSITFKPADGNGMDCGGTIKDGAFTVECTDGEKIIQAYGSKVVGEFVPDPLYPDRKAKKLEDFPSKIFTEEIKVTVEKKKNQVFDIEYTGEGAPKK